MWFEIQMVFEMQNAFHSTVVDFRRMKIFIIISFTTIS